MPCPCENQVETSAEAPGWALEDLPVKRRYRTQKDALAAERSDWRTGTKEAQSRADGGGANTLSESSSRASTTTPESPTKRRFASQAEAIAGDEAVWQTGTKKGQSAAPDAVRAGTEATPIERPGSEPVPTGPDEVLQAKANADGSPTPGQASEARGERRKPKRS
jgi:hypothetical protein